MTEGRQAHWEGVYSSKGADEVSWFEATPTLSLALIEAVHKVRGSVIDIGGGAARLADALVDRDYAGVAVLDLSARALDIAKSRLGARADRVNWIHGDVTTWRPDRTFDVWHDRAAFHFLNEADQQAAHAATLRAALNPLGIAVIGTFDLDGPDRCSGLTITRHNAESIAEVIGSDFVLIGERRHEHMTPGGAVQRFQFSTFRKV